MSASLCVLCSQRLLNGFRSYERILPRKYKSLVVSELIPNRNTTQVKFVKVEDKTEKEDIHGEKQQINKETRK